MLTLCKPLPQDGDGVPDDSNWAQGMAAAEVFDQGQPDYDGDGIADAYDNDAVSRGG